jgi:thiamine-monophosphate kinase
MKISEVGELDLIKALYTPFSTTGEDKVNLYPYDDCAVLDYNDKYLLITTDIINERTHVPEGASGFQLGWFLMAISLSDLAAKGAAPMGFLNALGLPPEMDVKTFMEIGEGIAACGRAYSCPVIGGDTKSATELTMAGMAFGSVKKDRFMPRVGAQPGDIVAVTGQLGRTGYALEKLEELQRLGEAETYTELLLKLVMEVKPQILAGQMLAKMKCVHASMDLSDGLGIALHQMSEVNQLGFTLEFDKLPRVPMLDDNESDFSRKELEEFLLYAGGDYELLLTLDPLQYKVAYTALLLLNLPLTAVGEVTSDRELVTLFEDGEKPLENRGFDHFGTN